jgi:2,3-bisphosphoglycerate-independent phosphoglycerate mutase
VPTYDKKPQMSAFEVTDELVRQLERGAFDFVVVNYANADMVGHSGILAAAEAAVEAVDTCLGRVVDATLAQGGACLITADHGNSDNMVDPGGGPNTAHSTNPVPFIATVDGVTVREGGILADLAPTILHLLGQTAHEVRTGRDLLLPAG